MCAVCVLAWWCICWIVGMCQRVYWCAGMMVSVLAWWCVLACWCVLVFWCVRWHADVCASVCACVLVCVLAWWCVCAGVLLYVLACWCMLVWVLVFWYMCWYSSTATSMSVCWHASVRSSMLVYAGVCAGTLMCVQLCVFIHSDHHLPSLHIADAQSPVTEWTDGENLVVIYLMISKGAKHLQSGGSCSSTCIQLPNNLEP